jgi:hypothetical protein
MQSSQSASRSSSESLNLCPCLRHVRTCWAKSHRLQYKSLALWHSFHRKSFSDCSTQHLRLTLTHFSWVLIVHVPLHLDSGSHTSNSTLDLHHHRCSFIDLKSKLIYVNFSCIIWSSVFIVLLFVLKCVVYMLIYQTGYYRQVIKTVLRRKAITVW